MRVTVDRLDVADPPDAWRQAGFTVEDGICRVGGVRIRLGSTTHPGTGIVGWTLRDLPPHSPDDLDGIPTASSTTAPGEPASHPNGVTSIDHLVLLTPHLARTRDALTAVGLSPRRERDAELGGRPMRQLFYRLSEVVLDVVGAPDAAADGPSKLWGITYVVDDIDATAAFFGEHRTPVKDAVQPGRRITTVRHRAYGMSVATAMISAPIV